MKSCTHNRQSRSLSPRYVKGAWIADEKACHPKALVASPTSSRLLLDSPVCLGHKDVPEICVLSNFLGGGKGAREVAMTRKMGSEGREGDLDDPEEETKKKKERKKTIGLWFEGYISRIAGCSSWGMGCGSVFNGRRR